jgi:hypothetical protein
MFKTTNTKLHNNVSEEKKSPNPDILPVSGAGQWGTDTLRQNYQNATPGQKIKKFKDYIKTK